MILIAREIQDQHEDAACQRLEGQSDVFSDLMNAALAEVCWIEIAEHLLAE